MDNTVSAREVYINVYTHRTLHVLEETARWANRMTAAAEEEAMAGSFLKVIEGSPTRI